MIFIILDQNQSLNLKGDYPDFNRINPILLKSGLEYILPVAILEGDFAPDIIAMLSQFPQREVSQSEFNI